MAVNHRVAGSNPASPATSGEDTLPQPPAQRPKTRADCVGGIRPCPWVSCRHHLFLEVDHRGREVRTNPVAEDPLDLPQTCSLDVAEQGGVLMEEVADLLGVSRQRVDLLLDRTIIKLRINPVLKKLRHEMDR